MNKDIFNEDKMKEMEEIKEMQKAVLKLMGANGSKKALICVKYDDIEQKIQKIMEQHVLIESEKELEKIYSFFEQIENLFNDFIEDLEKKDE